MIMSEDEEEEEQKIIWVDGIACIDLPPDSIMKKRQKNSVKHPFTFGCMQEAKRREFMPDIIKEFDKIFKSKINTPFFPTNWKLYEINQWGEIKEIKKEDEEDDNRK